jgi:hypothetical protein
MITKTFSALPRSAQFEVAQLLCHPILLSFLEQAAQQLLHSVQELTTPSLADPAKCQQFVAELQVQRSRAETLAELVAIAKTNFDRTNMEIDT